MAESVAAADSHTAGSPEERKQLRIIEALARSYSYTAYIDFETMTFEEISGLDYASERIGSSGSAALAFEVYLDNMVEAEYRENMRAFMDIATLKERLTRRSTISMEYVSAFLGWCRGTFLAAGRDENGVPVGAVYGLQSIAGEKNRETELLTTISSFSEKAYFDPVTGVRNRRYFEENVIELTSSFAVAMVDLDNFKEINESFGASVGDLVLSQAAREFLSCLRTEDVVVRHGEDDFVICFGRGDEDEVLRRLEKIRRSVETMNIQQFPDVHTTVSIGCAFRSSCRNMFLTADKMLYRAKQTKNMVAI
ncbi:MAG: GGDEF domain-containing protein [Selenomonadaceae bacterium]|nr:GGDEF domain-containing protein [Selenomonadaceae bacterium]